jgi:hypothetical protein
VTVRRWVPAIGFWILGALGWGLAMAMSFVLSIHVFGRATGPHDLGQTAL